jgi:hypothetical protein
VQVELSSYYLGLSVTALLPTASCDKPEPDMNAFTWELPTQLIGLHFSKHTQSPLVAISYCNGAIARTNRALKTKYNQLASTRGGNFATDSNKFTHPHHPQYFLHTPAHPEWCTEHRENPIIQDKAIFMADAVVGRTTVVLGAHNLPMIRHELKVQNLFSEIISVGYWHIRTADKHEFPIMGNLLSCHQRVKLKNIL